MAAVTESSAAMGMERRDWLKVSLATISRNHELMFKNRIKQTKSSFVKSEYVLSDTYGSIRVSKPKQLLRWFAVYTYK